MGPPEGRCRGEQLCPQYVARPKRDARRRASCFLCTASSIPSGRLRRKYIAPIQKAAWMRKSFEYGTWGGELRPGFEPKPGDIVATEHWCFTPKQTTAQKRRSGYSNCLISLRTSAQHSSARADARIMTNRALTNKA
jgi:hypothetical protein